MSWIGELKVFVNKCITENSKFHDLMEQKIMGFCPECSNPIDSTEVKRMSEKQQQEYRICGFCLNCQKNHESEENYKTVSEEVKEIILEIDGPKIKKELTKKEKNIKTELDIIDEDFL